MSLYLSRWPHDCEMDAGFRAEFPDMAKKIEKLGLGVYRTDKRKRPDLLGFPVWRLSHFDMQISGFTKDSPEKPYTRERLLKVLDKKLRGIRKGRREIANQTPEDRIKWVGELLDKNYAWAAERGLTSRAFISGYHPSGDYATATGGSYGAFLWGIGQVCSGERKWNDDTPFSDLLISSYRAMLAKAK
jgi:hypothetical protein